MIPTKDQGVRTWKTIYERMSTLDNGHQHVMLYGPPGTGKTFLAERTFAGRDPIVITLTEETVSAELRGHFIPNGQTWNWHSGAISRALQTGRPLILNEIGRASGDVYSYLLAVLDGSMNETLPDGSVARLPKNWSVISTSNDGPDALRPELMDRMVAIQVPYPDPAAIDTLQLLPQVIVRNAWGLLTMEDETRRIGLRDMVRINHLIVCGSTEEEAMVAVLGKHRTLGLMSSDLASQVKE